MAESAPDITLTLYQALCRAHGELFRAEWPGGYPLFLAEGFRRFLAKPETVEATGGVIARAGPLLDAKPLCCQFTPTELLALYSWVNRKHGRKLWPRKLCESCGNEAYGGAFLEHAHICLRCVVRAVQAQGNGGRIIDPT